MANKTFKYINKENYLEFVLGMSDKIDQVMEDKVIQDFFQRNDSALDPNRTPEDTLKLAESFLHLMVDYEEYETCQVIIDNYPELKNEVTPEEALDNMFADSTPEDLNNILNC